MGLAVKAGEYGPLMLLLTPSKFFQYTVTSYVRRYSGICDALLLILEAVFIERFRAVCPCLGQQFKKEGDEICIYGLRQLLYISPTQASYESPTQAS